MGIESEKEKIEFLEKVLKIAEKNPQIITDKGRGIFLDSNFVLKEECIIGLHLDEKGKAYFRIKGTYAENSDRINTPEFLLASGQRYLPEDLDKFKQEFHLYKNRRKDCKLDLLDSIR